MDLVILALSLAILFGIYLLHRRQVAAARQEGIRIGLADRQPPTRHGLAPLPIESEDE